MQIDIFNGLTNGLHNVPHLTKTKKYNEKK